MSNLKLITTEMFNNLSCNFYKHINDDILQSQQHLIVD